MKELENSLISFNLSNEWFIIKWLNEKKIRKGIKDLESKEKLEGENKVVILQAINKIEQETIKEKRVQSWWKTILCCGKDKNEPSIRDSLSLDNDERLKGIQEHIDNQEEIKEDYRTIDVEEKETISTSQPTNVFRKRNISNSQENRPSQEIYELTDLKIHEELETKIEIPPKK